MDRTSRTTSSSRRAISPGVIASASAMWSRRQRGHFDGVADLDTAAVLTSGAGVALRSGWSGGSPGAGVALRSWLAVERADLADQRIEHPRRDAIDRT